MVNNDDLNKAVREQLVNMKNNIGHGTSRFHILNDEGKVYSRFSGWQEFDMKIMGHQFQKEEYPVIVDLLKQHGHSSIQVKKDKTGTLFHLIDAVAIKKENIGIHLMLTLAFFGTWYIFRDAESTNAIMEFIRSSAFENEK